MAAVVHLDTHVVIWIKTAQNRLPPAVRRQLNEKQCLISPAVQLELQFLHEIGRLRPAASDLVRELSTKMGLQLDTTPFVQVMERALDWPWTRDPFDRLICAQSLAADAPLLTRDETIRSRLPLAMWD
ncbi:MAG: PIN domain-containing protein [Gammaproteobacteria bacterium]|nr:PIN domain-containing protein [Gammaproteobacteria bacterium]